MTSGTITLQAKKIADAIVGSLTSGPVYEAQQLDVVPGFIPTYTSKGFLSAFLRLLPTGRMWPKESTSNLSIALEPQVGSYARSTLEGIAPSPILTGGGQASDIGSANRAGQLLADTMPYLAALGADTTTELLPEWQQTLGLPDPCLPPDASLSQQVAQVVTRFVGLGGQSIQYYVNYAASLGYVIEITEFGTFRADYSCADTGLLDPIYAFAWQVTSTDTGEYLFEADVNTADEALGSFGNDVLECELQRVAPAHTILSFNISGTFYLDESSLDSTATLG